MEKLYDAYVYTGQNSAAEAFSEYVLPLDELYSSEANKPLSRVLVPLDNGTSIEVGLRSVNQATGDGVRKLIEVYFGLPNSDPRKHYRYGIVHAPGRIAFIHTSSRQHEVATINTLMEATTSDTQVPRITEPRFFPTIVSAEIDGRPEQLVTGISGRTLLDALFLVTWDNLEMSEKERDIVSLFMLVQASYALNQLHRHNIFHGHPHTKNFHISDALSAHILDFDLSHPITDSYTSSRDERHLAIRTLGTYLLGTDLMQRAGLHVFSTLHDVKTQLKRLCAKYKIDISGQKVLEALSYKYRRILIRDGMKTLLKINSSGFLTLTASDITHLEDAIGEAIEKAPTILLDSTHEDFLRRGLVKE